MAVLKTDDLLVVLLMPIRVLSQSDFSSFSVQSASGPPSRTMSEMEVEPAVQFEQFTDGLGTGIVIKARGGGHSTPNRYGLVVVADSVVNLMRDVIVGALNPAVEGFGHPVVDLETCGVYVARVLV